MSREAREEAMAGTANNMGSSANSECPHVIVKGKRTKRTRLLQALAPAPAATSSGSSSGELSGSTTAATVEEEDMANCLILLAKGGGGARAEPWTEEEGGGGGGEGGEKLSNRRPAEVGVYAYECKTCNKCFPSFQALGGHRASHKRPKTLQAAAAASAEEKRATDEDGSLHIRIPSKPSINTLPNNGSAMSNTPTCSSSSNNNNNNNNNNVVAASHNKPRVHECSICGSEFSSGQALGGHMRRHRAPAPATEPPQEVKKERSIFSLDLNLPAPVDDERGEFPTSPSFAFSGKPPLVFSASALVDCHY